MMHHPAHRRAIGARPPRRRLAAFLLALTAAGAVTAATPIADASAAVANVTVTSHFVWTATSTNNVTLINNFATNNRPQDLLFITHNWTQGGVCGCKDDTSPVGVRYDTSQQKWGIFNEDGSIIPAGASFNVLVVPTASSSVFVQTARNPFGDSTFINSSLTNGLPGARLMITQVWNPGGSSGGTINNHAVGVRYDTSRRRWAIVNEDAFMTFEASFNVMVGTGNSGGGTSALQTATATNINGRITFISNSLTTGDPNEILFETPNLNPGGVGEGIPDPQPIATYWSGTNGKAAIFNDNTVAMPPGRLQPDHLPKLTLPSQRNPLAPAAFAQHRTSHMGAHPNGARPCHAHAWVPFPPVD